VSPGCLPDQRTFAAGGWENIGTHLQAGVDASKKASFGPLAVTASVLGVGWLAVLLYVDAIISPGDTGLIYNGATARLSYGMARNRNAPAALGRVNSTGIPWVGLLLSFVIGCVFFLPFPGWQSLVQFVTNTTVLSFGMGPLVLLALRRQIPEFPRAFRLRWPWVIASLALLSSNLIIFWSGWDTNWKMFAAIVIGFILLGGQQWLSNEPAPLDFRHGWWLLVWFAGLAVLSYLGPYPSVSKGAGNLGLLPTGWGALASVVLTAIVLALAYVCRLPSEQVRQQVQALGQPDDDSAVPTREA
jgi:amino acid transporter